MTGLILSIVLLFAIIFALFVFFDQGRITRGGTLYRLSSSEMTIALTFDDGPDPEWTPAILEELRKTGTKATFFLIGEKAARYPELVRLIAHEGHSIGNHTFRHAFWGWLRIEDYREEVSRTGAVLSGILGYEPKLFRPPRGLLLPSQKRFFTSRGYRIVLWSINSKDWTSRSSASILNNIKRRLGAGDIILLHDSGNVLGTSGAARCKTIEAVRNLVPYARNAGYSFVALS